MFSTFKLHPIFYWIGGPLIIAFGIFMQFNEADKNQQRRQALAAGAPAMVDIGTFDETKHMGPANEVSIRGQLDLSINYTLTREGKYGAKTIRWMAPLYDPAAVEPENPVRAIVLESDGKPEQDDLAAMMKGIANDRPIIEINGEESGPGRFRSMVREALEEQGLTLSPDAVFIDPFLEGREAALKPSQGDNSFSYGIMGVGLLVFGYGFLRQTARRRRASQ
ncbi:MAG: hypothetical protein KTR21_15175 [Rhodobacteraceae bacterium]|nr:hypothetical protein [Paracoccaceae bacterium]